ncbi:MAG: portal protein [Actinomycetales bacterium]|nr:portal protein [Actinomycetales bacterium]
MDAGRVVVIGRTDVGRRACALLQDAGMRTVHLDEPSDSELHAALSGQVDGVAVLLHDDIRALRYSLMIEHLRPGIRLFVAIFDRTVRKQLESTVPNCVVLSPASIAVPAIVAAAIVPEHGAIRRREGSQLREWVAIDATAEPDEPHATVTPYETPGSLRARGIVGRIRGQLHAYDSGSAVLLGGAFGLLLIILVDTLIGLRHNSLTRALYDATRTTATISAPPLEDVPGDLVWATVAALLVMGLTAAFAAGIVHHLLSGRHVALVGRRVIPRSGHVVVVGMGQVGLRLAQELRDLGVAVLGIERVSTASGLGLARDLGIPVLIGDATSRRVLRRAGLSRAAALVAAGSEERDSIAVALAATAVAPGLQVVLRAGADDAIDETRSLFPIGPVIDVNGLTAAFVSRALLGEQPYAVIPDADQVICLSSRESAPTRQRSITAWCDCS